MRILFSLQQFSCQFRRLAPALRSKAMTLFFWRKTVSGMLAPTDGVRLREYKTHRQWWGRPLHPYLRRFESCVLHGQAVYRACEQLKQEGWEPDWIINHVGFGNGLYLSDAFPGAKGLVCSSGTTNRVALMSTFCAVDRLSQIGPSFAHLECFQTLLEIADCDYGVVPTQWQLDQFPEHLRSRLHVIHEGIDVSIIFLCLKQAHGRGLRVCQVVLKLKCSLM